KLPKQAKENMSIVSITHLCRSNCVRMATFSYGDLLIDRYKSDKVVVINILAIVNQISVLIRGQPDRVIDKLLQNYENKYDIDLQVTYYRPEMHRPEHKTLTIDLDIIPRRKTEDSEVDEQYHTTMRINETQPGFDFVFELLWRLRVFIQRYSLCST
ncbi:MAG: hypothetical protein QXY15_11215, partial [Candidatus Nitrosotenuis sp.]